MNNVKCFLVTFGILSLNFMFSEDTFASILTIDKNGEIIMNVLSEEDSVFLELPDKENMEVKKAAGDLVNGETKVSIHKEDGKLTLNINDELTEKKLDITDYKENIVEIDQRPNVDRIIISVDGENIAIRQKGVTAKTKFEVDIDPVNAGLTLKTPSGLRFLSVLPRDAVESLLKAGLIDQVTKENAVDIEETDAQLVYSIKGERLFNVFNLFDYPLSVHAKVSALTGKITSIEEPNWLKYLSFLFV